MSDGTATTRGARPFVATDEQVHPVDPDDWSWNESWFFSWIDLDGGPAGFFRLGLLPNQRRAMLWSFVHVDGRWLGIEESWLPYDDIETGAPGVAYDRWGLGFGWRPDPPLEGARFTFAGSFLERSGTDSGAYVPAAIDVACRATSPVVGTGTGDDDRRSPYEAGVRSGLDRAARIEGAALHLLESSGVDAVTTRAVAEAAGTQPMAIYRAYGDMDGLLDAVLARGFDAYLVAKRDRPLLEDPVDDLRQGWDLHVGFGLEHPHLYAAMYSSPDPSRVPAAVVKATLMLDEMVERIAKAGRLRTGVRPAASMIHAAGVGVTLSLIATDPEQRDPDLSDQLREAVLTALTTGPAVEAPSRARHAASLAATIDDGPAVLSGAEAQLLREWLDRLASAPARG